MVVICCFVFNKRLLSFAVRYILLISTYFVQWSDDTAKPFKAEPNNKNCVQMQIAITHNVYIFPIIKLVLALRALHTHSFP